MRYRYLVPVIALVLCLVSCKDSKNKKEVDTFGTDTFHTYSINGNYNIDVPNFMTGNHRIE